MRGKGGFKIMRDSFGNELNIGDRILCIKEKYSERVRENQIGIIAGIEDSTIIIINYDLEAEGGWDDHTLGIEGKHGNYISLQQDTFIKVETHTDVIYREGDKVLCYCPIGNDKPFIGRVVCKAGDFTNNVCYIIKDSSGLYHYLANNEILFLLERKQYEVGDEVVILKNKNDEDNYFLFEHGYNQTISTTIDYIRESRPNVRIEIDNPKMGWTLYAGEQYSYWNTNLEELLPKEFAYSLPYVEYLKSETTNTQVSTTGTRASSIEIDEYSSPLAYYVGSLECDLPPTTKLIHDYSYKPEKLNFFSEENEQINDDSLFLGLEVEISGSTKDIDNEEDAKEIMEIFKKTSLDEKSKDEEFVYFKPDSSLNGFEIILHPHTQKALEGLPWEEFFEAIKRMKYTNDDKKAGLHIHMSRSYFGDITKQNEALAKMVFLMYKFKEEIEPLAGRKDSDYATYSSKALERAKENDLFGTFRWYSDSCGKYSAINCQHKNTFEIRIFDGATNTQDLMDRLHFVVNLCTIVKCTSITDITKVRLEDFMPFLRSIEG